MAKGEYRGKSTNESWLIIIVIGIIFWYYMKKRKSIGMKCADVWNLLCVECRQVFFENMSTMDNNASKKSAVETRAFDNNRTYYNQKVVESAQALKVAGRIDDSQKQDIVQCMSESENTLVTA